ncbi:MAG: esterase/lipase family protein [Sphingopyxis sp.]
MADWLSARIRPVAGQWDDVGQGAPVITLPGFCANDRSMEQMRRNLRAAGFRARGWHMGANYGARADTLHRIDARVQSVADREGRAVHLVGWSLGGVFAREYAKQHPAAVASVVTMGSPFSGDPRANHAWRLYRMVAGHSVDNPPIAWSPLPKPPVPTFALWSPRDGVIAPPCAHGQDDERDVVVELACTHMGFAYHADAIAAVVDCLLQAQMVVAP